MKKKIAICLLIITMLFALAGCDLINGLLDDIFATIDSIELVPESVLLTEGDKIEVVANVKGGDVFIPEDILVSSSNEKVATVKYVSGEDTSFTYEITGVSAGSTTIIFDTDIPSESFEEATLVVTVISKQSTVISLDDIPEYSGAAYIAINNNVPFFTESEIICEPYEYYSELDSLGRCGVTMACVCIETMPTEERGEIGSVKPTGWHTVKYDIVSGKYLYNRCHLIGFQLTGENANPKNLITGTRYLNIDGNLVFENMVADYVKETNNHVMYRVTPIFEGNNLVASGVLMEGWSVEDDGDGICFNVYCYNVQPGIIIDYATGESCLAE